MLQRRIYLLLFVLTIYHSTIVDATSTTHPHKKLYTSPIYKRHGHDSNRYHNVHLTHINFVPASDYEEAPSTTIMVDTSVPTFVFSDDTDPDPPTSTSYSTSISNPMPTPNNKNNNSSTYDYDGDDDSDDSGDDHDADDGDYDVPESANDEKREANQRAQAEKQDAQMHEIEVVLFGVGGVIMVAAIIIGAVIVRRRRRLAVKQNLDEETNSPSDVTLNNNFIGSKALSTHLPITPEDLPPLLPLPPLSHIITNIEMQRSSYIYHPTAPSAKEFSDNLDPYSCLKAPSSTPSIQYPPSEATLDITDLPAYTPSAPLYKELIRDSDDDESDEKG